MAQFTAYASTDASAPVLTGEAGKLTDLLDAVLVNGYGAKSAAGWSINQTAANKRVYLQGAGSNGFVCRVNDTGDQAGGARDAVFRGGTSATDADTLVGPFPTTTQLADASSCIRKSATADNVARAWKCWADAKTFHLFIVTGDSTTLYMGVGFGDMDKFYTDSYSTLIWGGIASSASARTAEYSGGVYVAAMGTASTSYYAARSVAGTGGSEPMSKWVPRIMTTSAHTGGPNTFKNQGDGCILLEPVEYGDTTAVNIRGRMRGLYVPLHTSTNFADGDTISGTGAYASKTFLVLKGFVSRATGMLIIETSNTLS